MEEEPGCRKEALGEAVCVRVHACVCLWKPEDVSKVKQRGGKL